VFRIDQAPVALVVAPVNRVVKELHQFRVIRSHKEVLQVAAVGVEYYPVAVVVEVEILVITLIQKLPLALKAGVLEVAAVVNHIQCLIVQEVEVVAGGLQEEQDIIGPVVAVITGAPGEVLTVLAASVRLGQRNHPVVQGVNALTSTAIQ
jgi:hypothetical protein